ncbi:MAG: FKBP-type peptidyl-prolyl cis-trans isomerase, partial [Burkholderiales bacterium]|nr:FKBP-type peptidyl-prolyl cis-trans isomerase [Burkholderiales bacterium]
PAAAEPETDEQKTLYAIGVVLSQQLQAFALTEEELAFVNAGIADAVMKRPQKVEMQAYAPKIRELAQQRLAAFMEQQAEQSKGLMEKAAGEPGAVKTASGAIVVPIKEGTGTNPRAEDTVKVHYHGTLVDGTVFDSSVDRGLPATFPLSNVIKCWTEGVQKIKVGGKARLVCPADVAYGDRGAPPNISPGATLIFEVEL